MWFYNEVFYQIYTLGFCGAPAVNDGMLCSRIKHVEDFIPHLKRLNIGAVYFCPLFESDAHGYDTRDFLKLDVRLGTNEDFEEVCKKLHANGIRVVLDGVFNHVGRGFFAFRDVCENRHNSRYKDWFHISFDGNSCYNDGFWYEGWEGHYELVRLNLQNHEVVNYLLDCVGRWIDMFDIDGLRLDVAYMLDRSFMRCLREYCDSKKDDFCLIGEMIHGDYNQLLESGMLHCVTNYECYKGLYSSFNSMNMFEIGHSLKRQFGNEQWCLYTGKHLMGFADNHDVTRLASVLLNKSHIIPLYGLLMGMPGVPCIYYGSEWGAEGVKSDGDGALRPFFESPISNDITEALSAFIKAHKSSKALINGDFTIMHMTNRQLVFKRCFENECILVCINAEESAYTAWFDFGASGGTDMITGNEESFENGLSIPGYGVKYILL